MLNYDAQSNMYLGMCIRRLLIASVLAWLVAPISCLRSLALVGLRIGVDYYSHSWIAGSVEALFTNNCWSSSFWTWTMFAAVFNLGVCHTKESKQSGWPIFLYETLTSLLDWSKHKIFCPMVFSFDPFLVLSIVYPLHSGHTNIKFLSWKFGDQICCSLNIVRNALIHLLLEVFKSVCLVE